MMPGFQSGINFLKLLQLRLRVGQAGQRLFGLPRVRQVLGLLDHAIDGNVFLVRLLLRARHGRRLIKHTAATKSISCGENARGFFFGNHRKRK